MFNPELVLSTGALPVDLSANVIDTDPPPPPRVVYITDTDPPPPPR